MRDTHSPYGEIGNAPRLKENRNMLEMASLLSEKYFSEIRMTNDFKNRFNRNAELSINAAIESTFCLLGGEDMIIVTVMKKILEECSVRKAIYRKNYLSTPKERNWKFNQEPFCLDYEDDDFLWIEDYKKSLWTRERDEYEKNNDNPCLIIRESKLIELFQCEVFKVQQAKKISSKSADKILSNVALRLKKMQIIYKQYRTDNKWGRSAVYYPVYKITERYDSCNDYSYDDDVYNKKTICNMDYEPVIQINTEHPCVAILKQRMNNLNDTFDFMDDRTIQGRAGRGNDLQPIHFQDLRNDNKSEENYSYSKGKRE